MRNPEVLDEKARAIGYQSYDHYLKSSLYWHAFRQRRIGNICSCCYEARPYNLVLHHVSYQRLGEERPSDVVTLCRWCHEKVHQMIHDGDANFADAHVSLRVRFLESGRQMALTFYGPDSDEEDEAA